MSNAELKSDILKLLQMIDDDAFLYAIRILLLKQIPNSDAQDFWDDLPIGIQKEIDTAIKEADRENFISHSDVMKEMRVKYL